jgi:hypothetical protein
VARERRAVLFALESCAPVTQCPSDPDEWRQQTDYLGNCGTEGLNAFNGFVSVPASTAAAFLRGLSNVVAVSEFHGSSLPLDVTLPVQSRADWKRDADLCQSLSTSNRESVHTPWFHVWFRPGRPDTCYNHVVTPNGNICINDAADAYQKGMILTPQSYHFDGVNVLLADGSTRFVSNDIRSNEWVLMGTRTGRSGLIKNWEKNYPDTDSGKSHVCCQSARAPHRNLRICVFGALHHYPCTRHNVLLNGRFHWLFGR